MKKLILIAAMAMTFFAVSAQTPKIKYQAVVRDNDNRLVTNTAVTADVTVTYGSNTYTETGLAATTNANGLLTLEIGNASGFEAIDWSNATITTTVSFGSQTIENTATATAVPYALNAGIASDLDPNDPKRQHRRIRGTQGHRHRPAERHSRPAGQCRLGRHRRRGADPQQALHQQRHADHHPARRHHEGLHGKPGGQHRGDHPGLHGDTARHPRRGGPADPRTEGCRASGTGS